MTQLTISLPDTAQTFINEQITNGTYTTVDDLFAALIEQAQERQAKQTVNAMLRSTLQKNKTIANPSFGESIVAFREKHNISQMEIDPDEIWGNVRDRNFVGTEVSFE
jgi:Arc/MetJ-type ribon-helix-helix transcriptional regulator